MEVGCRNSDWNIYCCANICSKNRYEMEANLGNDQIRKMIEEGYFDQPATDSPILFSQDSQCDDCKSQPALSMSQNTAVGKIPSGICN